MTNIKEEILLLKKEKKAIIMAHYYQPLEIQEIADFIGDSYDLAVKAKMAVEETIVFCGVSFMAETAKILSPKKRVLNPNPHACCPMAEMISGKEVNDLRNKYPGAEVVAYVNTYADVKAVSDVCVTSSTAVTIVNKLKSDTIIFVPDKNLADYVQRFTKKEIIPGDGFCYVHSRFNASAIMKAKEAHPDALLLVHPECPREVIDIADAALSTSGMINYVKESPVKKFLIGTEHGLVIRLAKLFPDKIFYTAGAPSVCVNMKKITLEDVYNVLLNENNEVILADEIMNAARRSLERMIEMGS